MKKFLKIALLVLLGLIVLGTFVFLYQKSQPAEELYELHKVEKADITISTVATGRVEPRDEVQIKPQISGIISELYKQAGDMVNQGDIIAKVKVIPDMGQLNAAESRVRLAQMSKAQAETDLERMQQLYEKKLVSAEEYEKTLLATKQAREEVKSAVDNLQIVKEGITTNGANMSSTLIRSTVSGLILDIPVKVGNSVVMSNTFNDGTTIAYVANMNDLIFRGNVDETEVGRIYEGLPVRIKIGAVEGNELDATLEYVSPKSIAQGGANQFEIKAAIRVPKGITIRSGYSANATMVLNKAEGVLSVPENAVEFQGDSTFVYLHKSGNNSEQIFERIAVKTGLSDGARIEIKSGLKEGQEVRGLKK